MKQTAVEWYAEQYGQLIVKLLKGELENEQDFPRLSRKLKNCALEIEYKQMADTWAEAADTYSEQNFETYYNQTFKNENYDKESE